MKKGSKVLLAAGAVLISSYAEGAVRRVKQGATGAGNGSSWTDAYATLQGGITAASSGDELWVFQGTYRPTEPNNPSSPTTQDRDKSFVLKAGVAIYGGFDSTGDVVRTDRNDNPASNGTILSGDLADSPTDHLADSNNSFQVVTGDDVDGATLDGFTIEAGYALEFTGNPAIGAGIYQTGDGVLHVLNCIIQNNSAVNGGGVYVAGGEGAGCSFTDCRFIDNFAKVDGGGIYNDSDVEIEQCYFYGNSVDDNGGAIFSVVGTGRKLRAYNSLFYENDAWEEGGAIHAGTDVTLLNVTVTRNDSRTPASPSGFTYFDGAGLFVPSGAANVENCIFWNNNRDDTGHNTADEIDGTTDVTWSDIQDDNEDGNAPFGGSANGNIDETPDFVDVANDNYRLDTMSGCIDSARTIAVVGLDLDREDRVENCRADMGAYETNEAGGACCVDDTCSAVENVCECVTLASCDVADHLPGTFTGCYGDADGNGTVNAGDRGFVSANYSTADPVLMCLYDMYGNGVVNAGDRGVVSANIGACNALLDFQNGSGLNNGEHDTRFPGTYLGDSTTCGESSCD